MRLQVFSCCVFTEWSCLAETKLTQAGLDDLDGAVVVLDGLAVLVHVAQCGGHMVVSLGQQTTVRRQVLQLQAEALLEVF